MSPAEKQKKSLAPSPRGIPGANDSTRASPYGELDGVKMRIAEAGPSGLAAIPAWSVLFTRILRKTHMQLSSDRVWRGPGVLLLQPAIQHYEWGVIASPVRTLEDVQRMKPFDAESDLGYVMDAIRILRGNLKGVPLIGFCGAPFTVASYIIEGGSSREFLKTKLMMYNAPEVFQALMEKLSDVWSNYLVAQIQAGAQAVQIFDSWVGALSPQDYEMFVLPYSQKVLKAAEALNVPVIHFGTNTTTLLPLMKRAGGTVLGLDWRLPLDDGWKIIGYDRAVQGNLDPALLFAPLSEIKTRVHDILLRAESRPGHIFNLGHGILQHTPVDNVKAVVELVHEYSTLLQREQARVQEAA